MSDLSDIRDGIKTVVESQISGLRVYPYPPANHHAPCLVVQGDGVDGTVETVDGDTYEVNLEMVLFLEHGTPEEGWRELDAYKSPSGSKSILAAIRTDRTLNGSADVADVGWPLDNPEELGAREYSAVFPIRVLFSAA